MNCWPTMPVAPRIPTSIEDIFFSKKKADAVFSRSAAGRSLVIENQCSSTHTPTHSGLLARFRPKRFRMSEVKHMRQAV
jgi:hypothetical protein